MAPWMRWNPERQAPQEGRAVPKCGFGQRMTEFEVVDFTPPTAFGWVERGEAERLEDVLFGSTVRRKSTAVTVRTCGPPVTHRPGCAAGCSRSAAWTPSSRRSSRTSGNYSGLEARVETRRGGVLLGRSARARRSGRRCGPLTPARVSRVVPKLVQTSRRVAATRGRLAKIELLADLLNARARKRSRSRSPSCRVPSARGGSGSATPPCRPPSPSTRPTLPASSSTHWTRRSKRLRECDR